MVTITLNINWSHLSPQFEEMMKDSQYTLPEIRECLSNVHNWTETLPFEQERFCYEGDSFTLTQLANTVEMIAGDDRQFVEVMRLKLVSIADKLLDEYYEELNRNEQQELLHAEHKETIEKGDAA